MPKAAPFSEMDRDLSGPKPEVLRTSPAPILSSSIQKDRSRCPISDYDLVDAVILRHWVNLIENALAAMDMGKPKTLFGRAVRIDLVKREEHRSDPEPYERDPATPIEGRGGFVLCGILLRLLLLLGYLADAHLDH